MKWVKYAVAAWMGCAALVSGAQAEEAKATASANANAIEAINTSRNGNEIAIKIDLNKHMASPPASFAVSNPPKVALDFLGTVNALGKNTQQVNEGDLRSLNVVQVGDKTRVVLNLVRSMNYNTRVDGNSLYVTLTPIERVNDVAAERSQRFQEANPLSTGHAVRDLVFRRGKDGEGRVVVDLSDPGTAIDIRKQGANLVVDFIKTTLPENLRRKLDVTDFATPVLAVETKPVGQNTRLTISPKGAWEHNAYQADNQFIVEVKQIVEDPNKLVQGTKIGYQGPRVSINYQNGDVRALLRLMAEELGLNAVISETVTGTTTLVLKDVPADQVIDIIFQQKGLDMRKKGNIIMIAPRDEIATREKLDFESRQQIRELEPLQTEQFALNYQKAADVAAMLAGPGGGSEAESGGGTHRLLSKQPADASTKRLGANVRLDHNHLKQMRLQAQRVFLIEHLQTEGDIFRLGIAETQSRHQKALLKHLRIFLRVRRVACLAFPRQVSDAVLLDHLPESLIDLNGLERFEQIVLDTEADCFLCVVKMPIAADDDEIDRRVQRFSASDQFDPVVAGHPDVGDHDIRSQLRNRSQSRDAVISGGNKIQPKRLPVDQTLDQQQDFRLIVSD